MPIPYPSTGWALFITCGLLTGSKSQDVQKIPTAKPSKPAVGAKFARVLHRCAHYSNLTFRIVCTPGL